MNLTLDYTPTYTEFRQLLANFRSRRYSIIRVFVGVALIVFVLQQSFSSGFKWLLLLCLAVAIELILSDLIFAWIVRAIWRSSMLRVTINDHSISVEHGKHRHEIRWSSFAMTGTAREIENHFLLECGRGTVWIPKRAFPTETDMANFRALVKDQMGVKCHFES